MCAVLHVIISWKIGCTWCNYVDQIQMDLVGNFWSPFNFYCHRKLCVEFTVFCSFRRDVKDGGFHTLEIKFELIT